MKLHLRTILIMFLVVATIASQGAIGIDDVDGLTEVKIGFSDSPKIIEEGNLALETCEDRKDRIRDL